MSKPRNTDETATLRDDVIKRMLNTPPAPRKAKPKTKKPPKKKATRKE